MGGGSILESQSPGPVEEQPEYGELKLEMQGVPDINSDILDDIRATPNEVVVNSDH